MIQRKDRRDIRNSFIKLVEINKFTVKFTMFYCSSCRVVVSQKFADTEVGRWKGDRL